MRPVDEGEARRNKRRVFGDLHTSFGVHSPCVAQASQSVLCSKRCEPATEAVMVYESSPNMTTKCLT